jgi:hypothetical protein
MDRSLRGGTASVNRLEHIIKLSHHNYDSWKYEMRPTFCTMDTPNIVRCTENCKILECHNNCNDNGNSYIGSGGFNRKMEDDKMLCILLLFDCPYCQ